MSDAGGPVAALSEAVHRVYHSGAPDDVHARARTVALDTVGVTVLGMQNRVVKVMAGQIDGTGCSRLWGSRRQVGADDAAAVHAAACTATQFDEGHRESRGHPGLHVVGAAFAVGEQLGCDGYAIERAVIAGYEVAARMGRYLGPLRGDVHPHGGAGTAGAAVVSALLHGAGPSEVGAAIEAAAAMALSAPAVTARSGTDVHHYYAAHGARTGVHLGRAAAAGMTTGMGLVDDLARRVSAGPRDTDLLRPRIADGCFEISDGYLKPAPICAHLLTTWTCARKLRGRLKDPIDSVEVRAFAAAAALKSAMPTSPLACRFSLPYVLAVTLLNREELLVEPNPHDPDVRTLIERIRVTHDPGLDSGYPAGRPVGLRIHTRTGATLTSEAVHFPGDRERPMPAADVDAKFLASTTPTLGHAVARKLLVRLRELDRVASIGDLSAFAASPNPGGDDAQ